jgi:hypothetical protein
MTLLWSGADPFLTMEGGMRTHRGPVPGRDAKDSDSGFTEEERSQMMTEHVAAVVRVIEDYHSVLENDGVPHIFALQPLLYLSKKPRHEWENKVEPFGEHTQYYGAPSDRVYKYIIDRVKVSAHKKQYSLADFSDYFDDTSEWVFTDWCHLTAGANYLIAKELTNIIKETIFQRPLNEGDKTDQKNSFFWDVALSANVVYAPPADDSEHDAKNMLVGYPGQWLYSSKPVAQGERFEIVLDLTRILSLSRLRLVWDDSSVPEEWVMDISLDGENWKTWVQGNDKRLDNLSLWPGYEYYGSEPVQARFLRYTPTKTQDRSISLRSWSVYR